MLSLAADFPIVSSWNCKSFFSPSSAGTGEPEKNAVPIADSEDALSRSRSSGAVIGPPRATVYLLRGVGLTLDGRSALDLGGGSPLGDGLLVIAGGEIVRDISDADAKEIEAPDECDMSIPSPSPTPAGRPAMESGRVAEVRDDGGECEGEKVPSDGEA